jgi:YYY domain-containing protein
VASFLTTVWKVIPEASVLGVLSIVLYLPFWFALRSQAGGILPNLFNATKPQHFVVMFLPLLIPAIGVIVGSARRRSVKPLPTIGLGMALVVAIALVALIVGSAAAYPYIIAIIRGESVQGYSLSPETVLTALKLRLQSSWIGLFLAIGVAAALSTMVQSNLTGGERASDSPQEPQTAIDDGYPLLLALMGLLLTVAPEFVYLQDVFMTRMNTIFKFYFQAWVLWSLAGAWQLTVWLQPIKGAMKQTVGRRIAAAVALLMIAAGLIYTVLAIPARAREQGVPWTLDGAAWLQHSYPEDAAAIAWLNDNIEGTPVIVEAPGDQHRAYVYEGRISAFTGLPAVLGWGGHQLQWRGNYDESGAREADLSILMTTLNHTEAARILERYNVGYIYVGPLERQRYPEEALAKFAEMFPTVYDQNGVTIYQVR